MTQGPGVLAGTGDQLRTGWTTYAPDVPGAPGFEESTAAGPAGIDLSGIIPNDLRSWYSPAQKLNQRTVTLKPGVPGLLSGANPVRKFASVFNNDTAITVYLGDSAQVTDTAGDFGGFPLGPQTPASFDQHEYAGDLWGVIPAGAANSVDVRVMDPSAGF